jgi:hypothetical protein
MYRYAAATARGAVVVLALAALMLLLTGIGGRAPQSNSSVALSFQSSVNRHLLPTGVQKPAIAPTPTPVP